MNNLVRLHQAEEDVLPTRVVHIIADDGSDDENEKDEDVVYPDSNRGTQHNEGLYGWNDEMTMMQQHHQQYHHFDPRGRFDTATSRQHIQQPSRGQPLPQLPLSNGDGPSWNHEGPSLMQTELIAFRKAARMAHTIGSMIIKRQAAMINHQLVQLQKDQADRISVEESTNNHVDSAYATVSPCKRRRIDISPSTEDHPPQRRSCDDDSFEEKLSVSQSTHHETTAANVQESPCQSLGKASTSDHDDIDHNGASSLNTIDAMNIWYQVDRMKRMSLFLTNAQMAQSLMYEEMKECYYEIASNNPSPTGHIHSHHHDHNEKQDQDESVAEEEL